MKIFNTILILIFLVSCNAEKEDETGLPAPVFPSSYITGLSTLCGMLPVSQDRKNDCLDDKINHMERLYYRGDTVDQAYDEIYSLTLIESTRGMVVIDDVINLKI